MSYINFTFLKHSSQQKLYSIKEDCVVFKETEIFTDYSEYYDTEVHVAAINFHLTNNKIVCVHIVERMENVTREEFIEHINNGLNFEIAFYQLV